LIELQALQAPLDDLQNPQDQLGSRSRCLLRRGRAEGFVGEGADHVGNASAFL